MRRRQFCTTALSAGVAAALPLHAASSTLQTIAGLPGEIKAVSADGDELVIERAAAMELQESLQGPLLFPYDYRYEDTRSVWNAMVDKRPAMIAQCATPEDVSNAVTFAAERHMLLSVKSGGHSIPGKSVCDSGLMIDLSAMHEVAVDPGARTARVQGGALLGDLDAAALAHGLVTTTGTVSHTGVGGFTLGGGFGRTDRVHGLAVDNVLAATLVTADGKIRRVDAQENADLHWAIRGGGGNFGVVTEFTYRLHPFNPTIYGGSIFYPFAQAREVLNYWAEVDDTLPNAASVEPQLFPTPDGGRMLELQLFFAGDHAEGEKIFGNFVRVGQPERVDLGTKSYRQVQTMWDEMLGFGNLNYIKSGLLPALTPAVIEAIMDNYEGDFLPATWLQHLGGKTATIDPQATAFPHRNVHSNLGISGFWQDPAESEARIAKIRQIYAAVQPYTKGYYANLNEEPVNATQRNYGVNYERLVQVKNRYDPTNLFRLNANIEPTGESS